MSEGMYISITAQSFRPFRLPKDSAPVPSTAHSVSTSEASLAAALFIYIDKALSRARYEYLDDDQQYYGEIPGFAGVFASGDTEGACAAELREVLIGWIALRLEDGRALPAAVPDH
jgi:predicted RNase H-like HicB family nuclease